MPDSEDNIYYKISRMLKDEFDAFRKEIKADIREATNDYKQLWQRTEEQEGKINSLLEFKSEYKPKIEKNTLITWATSILVPVIMMAIFVAIQTWGGKIG